MGSASLGSSEGDFMTTAQALHDIDCSGYIILENNYDPDALVRVEADVATLTRAFSV